MTHPGCVPSIFFLRNIWALLYFNWKRYSFAKRWRIDLKAKGQVFSKTHNYRCIEEREWFDALHFKANDYPQNGDKLRMELYERCITGRLFLRFIHKGLWIPKNSKTNSMKQDSSNLIWSREKDTKLTFLQHAKNPQFPRWWLRNQPIRSEIGLM